ncbi:hypothetical protein PENTCL1PPCAC_15372 [Pristionchus entomophagus]|uniref:G protein-coupled receptor n=1 Tax=Pristionchus entomophagus TaxID=358040 RepID=A0AAV5TEX1_9BILA|nr:hypothetical protein PENTCL1PPCAC_15372 [Pristionchus entomophagus]
MAFYQGLIAEWMWRKEQRLGPQELHFFPLIFAHQAFFNISTISLFYLTCERLLLCFRPTFYASHKWRLSTSLFWAVFMECLIVAPLTLMLQYGQCGVIFQLRL